MSPKFVRFLRILIGPGRSVVPEPTFDEAGNLDVYPDPDFFADKFFRKDPRWVKAKNSTAGKPATARKR